MDQLTRYWDDFVSKRAHFLIPEPFLDHLYKHQLAILDMHRLRFAPTEYQVQLVGPDWYWDASIGRDAPYMHLAWDLAGYQNISRSLWNTLLAPRSKLPRARWTVGQWDGQGQILWGLTFHYLLTGVG